MLVYLGFESKSYSVTIIGELSALFNVADCLHSIRCRQKLFYQNPTIFGIERFTLYLPPAHWAAMKKTAFNNETLPAAIIQIVTAGLSCPPDTCWTAIARVAMLRPWLNAMCITEGGVSFHGKTVPQTMNRNKSVARSSASTSVQNDRERSAIFPSWKNILTCSKTGWLFPTRVKRSLRASGCQS